MPPLTTRVQRRLVGGEASACPRAAETRWWTTGWAAPCAMQAAKAICPRRSQTRLSDLGVRGGAGADRQLRVRRAHQHGHHGMDKRCRCDIPGPASVGWTLLEAVVHGVIVMLEWCYTLDLLNSPVMSGVASGLRQAQATLPSRGSCWRSRGGGVRAVPRHRAPAGDETLGQTLMMGAMMVGGLWVIINPLGHHRRAWRVGLIEASLGTLGAVTSGTPDHPDRTLAESMRDVFSGAIEGPWCYMEFGEVRWCENPAQRDPRLRAAGLKIAASEMEEVGCESGAQYVSPSTDHKLGLPVCVKAGSEQAKGLEHSAELLRKAQSNGESSWRCQRTFQNATRSKTLARCSKCCVAAVKKNPNPAKGPRQHRLNFAPVAEPGGDLWGCFLSGSVG